jgi:diacylglycerol O-acyltransferase
MGRRLKEIIPYVPIATTLRTGVAVLTYCDNVTFGITGDFRTSPDVDVLARGIEEDITELLNAARQHHRSKRARSDRCNEQLLLPRKRAVKPYV